MKGWIFYNLKAHSRGWCIKFICCEWPTNTRGRELKLSDLTSGAPPSTIIIPCKVCMYVCMYVRMYVGTYGYIRNYSPNQYPPNYVYPTGTALQPLCCPSVLDGYGPRIGIFPGLSLDSAQFGPTGVCRRRRLDFASRYGPQVPVPIHDSLLTTPLHRLGWLAVLCLLGLLSTTARLLQDGS
jgi:hypothetical protein